MYRGAMEAAVRELLIEKGVFDRDGLRRTLEDMDSRDAGLGAQMVARAGSIRRSSGGCLAAHARRRRVGLEWGPPS